VAVLSDDNLSQTLTKRFGVLVPCANPRRAHCQLGIPAATTALLGSPQPDRRVAPRGESPTRGSCSG